MTENREQWQVLLQDLARRQALAEQMGGAEKVAVQHQKGRLTARERLQLLFDADSFSEVGALAGGQHPGGLPSLAGDGVVGGIGRIDGRSVVALVEDFTVKGGTIGHVNAAKRTRLVRLALEQQLPLVIVLDGAGERAGNSGERYPHSPGDLQLVADLQGQVPMVTLVLGTSAGHGALTGMFADLIIMQRDATLFTAGPPLVQAALGLKVTPAELGNAVMHTRDSGVAHNMVDTEAQAFSLARRFLGYLPQCAGATVPSAADTAAAAPRLLPELLDIIPAAGQRSYNMEQVLRAVADADSLLLLQPDYGRSLLLALARIGGASCLVVANQPAVLAGAITADAALKASHFMQMANQFGLPLVLLLDNPGVMPGPASEQAGVLRAAGQMFAAQRRYRGRKIVITLRKAFGFGSSVMGMNPWDKQAINLALPSVSLGGVPAIGGAAAAGSDAAESQAMQQAQSGAWVPADAMAFDAVINPEELRNRIIEVLRR